MPYEIALGRGGETLVKDARLERVFYGLQKLVDFPDGTEFATYIQEPNERDNRHLAVFLVSSPHPRANKRAMTPVKVVTMSVMPLDRWREMEREHRHYANLTDPIRPIFAGILRRHMHHYNNLKDLN